jgi:hypothetical protein
MNHAKVVSIDGTTGWAQVVYYPDSAVVNAEPTWFLGPMPLCIAKRDGSVFTQEEFQQALANSIPHSSITLHEQERAGGWDVSGLLADTHVSSEPVTQVVTPTLEVTTLV